MAYDIKRLPSEASVDHDHEASLHDIKISGITKSFYNNGEMRQVLRPVNILIPHGKFVSIIGPSGCGKSTSVGHNVTIHGATIKERKAF